MKRKFIISFLSLIFVIVFFCPSLYAEAEPAPIVSPSPSPSPSQSSEMILADFEGETPGINRLGGPSGSWNLDEMDINNSYADEDYVKMPGKDGKPSKVL